MATVRDSQSRLELALSGAEPDLVGAALAMSLDEYPDLDEAAVVAQLDALAQQVRAELPPNARLEQQLQALSRVLGQDHGFHGTAQSYGEAKSSFLHEVLARRTGIPIALGVVYTEVARRAGVALQGIAFPGHFLVGGGSGASRRVLDPFHFGRQVGPDDLRSLLSKTAPGVTFSPQLLRPASPRQIVFRMLTNLKHLHIGAEDWPRALRVVELLLIVAPEHPGELRVRASVRQSLGAYAAALHDVQHCLALSPDAPDAVVLRWTAQALASRAGWRS